jgi:hypothetical protein
MSIPTVIFLTSVDSRPGFVKRQAQRRYFLDVTSLVSYTADRARFAIFFWGAEKTRKKDLAKSLEPNFDFASSANELEYGIAFGAQHDLPNPRWRIL